MNADRVLGQGMVGKIIDQRYEVLDFVGAGSHGTIYLVRHRTLGRKLAMKLVHPDRDGQEVTDHFRLEAQVTSQIHHENIVDISDYGYDPEYGYYMAMEHLEGVGLDFLIDDQGPFDEHRTMHIAVQVANAMCAAHARGVVHRDLSPRNIMILQRYRRPDVVKVLDFGVAYITNSDGTNGAKGVVGSPAYMSPEQVDGKPVDPRSDIYGLGAILYHMLTGVPPFEGDNIFSQLLAHLDEPPEPLRNLVPNIHPDVESLVLRCLEKSPKRRFRTMYTVSEACESAIRVLQSGLIPDGQQLHVAARRPKRRSLHFIEPAFRRES